jgi:hypothetical protein
MPAQTLYPRATVKKIVKAHAGKPLSKNVDVLVSFPYFSWSKGGCRFGKWDGRIREGKGRKDARRQEGGNNRRELIKSVDFSELHAIHARVRFPTPSLLYPHSTLLHSSRYTYLTAHNLTTL